jgi:hypothetical protein
MSNSVSDTLRSGEKLDKTYELASSSRFEIKPSNASTKSIGQYDATLKYEKPPSQPPIVPGGNGDKAWLSCFNVQTQFCALEGLPDPQAGYNITSLQNAPWKPSYFGASNVCINLTVQFEVTSLSDGDITVVIGKGQPYRISETIRSRQSKTYVVILEYGEAVSVSGFGIGTALPPQFKAVLKVLDNTTPLLPPQSAKTTIKSGLVDLTDSQKGPSNG